MSKFLNYPIKPFIVTQGFGDNANGSYAASGLKGHTALDVSTFWGDTIYLACDSWVYKTINFNNPDLGYYRCVFTIAQDGEDLYEISYGHCNTCLTIPGAKILSGTAIATEGNTGQVYYGSSEITTAQKLAGSKLGTHLHFQARPVELVDTIDNLEAANGHYLMESGYQGGNFLKSPEGKFYHIKDYDNGFHGCIDPTPFFNGFYAIDMPRINQEKQAVVETAGNVVQEIANSNEPNNTKVGWLNQIIQILKSLFNL